MDLHVQSPREAWQVKVCKGCKSKYQQSKSSTAVLFLFVKKWTRFFFSGRLDTQLLFATFCVSYYLF